GVKHIRVETVSTGAVVGEGIVVMPHLATWDRWATSSMLPVELDANTVYRIEISDDANMSYFDHFESYTGGLGGGADSFNMVNIAAVQVLAMDTAPGGWSAGDLVVLDGNADLTDMGAAQTVATGAPIDVNDAFALTWDADYLYVVVQSMAFADPYRPFSLYLE